MKMKKIGSRDASKICLCRSSTAYRETVLGNVSLCVEEGLCFKSVLHTASRMALNYVLQVDYRSVGSGFHCRL